MFYNYLKFLTYRRLLFQGSYISLVLLLVWTTGWQDLCFPFTVILPKQSQPFATRDSFLLLLKVADKIFSPWFLNWWNTTHDVLPSAVPLMAAGSDRFSTLQLSKPEPCEPNTDSEGRGRIKALFGVSTSVANLALEAKAKPTDLPRACSIYTRLTLWQLQSLYSPVSVTVASSVLDHLLQWIAWTT